MEVSAETAIALGKLGAVIAICLSAVGSALGTGAAGAAAVGAWKKCYAQNKIAPFLLVTFVGAPLSQTIYGMILMFAMIGKAEAAGGYPYQALIGMGLFAGLAIAGSAWMQGRAGAGACDALADTGKGFTNYLAALGVIETVAIFVMVFIIIALG
jgi:V/A-type H+/Na+-transporting ATPase subunit K